MSFRRLPTGTVSPPSREGRVYPRSDGSATDESSDAAALARENRRLRRENRRLRERLDAERADRQAVIDRYEGLVDESSADGAGASRAASGRRTTTDVSTPSAFDRLARLLGLR